MIKRKTDDEFIASLEKQSKYRRPIGAFFLVFGIVIAGFSIVKTLELQDQMIEISDVLAGVDVKDSQAVAHAANEASYVFGLQIGFALASSIALGGVMLVYGIHFLWGYRKEKLLVKFRRLAQEKGDV